MDRGSFAKRQCRRLILVRVMLCNRMEKDQISLTEAGKGVIFSAVNAVLAEKFDCA